jgi:hypothetical protein
MSLLYKQISHFNKLAQLSISSLEIVKNSDPILEELSKIREFEDRVKFADDHFERLGEGSSRTVFQMSDQLVLKVAHNDKGIAQNSAEMLPGAQRPCTNNVIVADAKGKWIVVRNNEKITKDDFEKIMGYSFKDFMGTLFSKFNNESDDWPLPKNHSEVEKSEFFKSIASLVFDNDLLLGDLDKIDSWGEIDGRVVLRDYGFSKFVHRTSYST